jgi:hypothetical protein
MFQKMQKLCGASAGCAEMRVWNPDASVILKPCNLFVHKSDLTVARPAYLLIRIFCGNVSGLMTIWWIVKFYSNRKYLR